VNETATPIDATISSQGDAMARVEELIDRVGEAFGVDPDVLTDLRIALDEVVTNILKYAYSDSAPHDIGFHWELRDGRLATIIEDDGVPFDPLRAPQPDTTSSLADRQVGGLGIVFLKDLMHSVTYERVAGRNRLTLEQDLNGNAHGT
jgi:anti-sigma regulatory factor (Ser/Thr protein kinase)